MSRLESWKEPIIRVQELSESGIQEIPDCFVKKPADRPCLLETEANIPLIDLEKLNSCDESVRHETMNLIFQACRDWGFFQVVNHGVSHDLMAKTRCVWNDFFHLPLEEKEKFANSPITYEGYGSRLGVEKGAKLDWCDYFFLHYLPEKLKDENKWPSLPISCREIIAEYGQEMAKISDKLLKILSTNLGLNDDYLHQSFGGNNEIGACLRVNFYPKCPQPDLTLGLSPHSDPGGLAFLLPDIDVSGLQVRRGDHWLTVKPVPNAFVVNIADMLEILTNGIYKSVEHRPVFNPNKERLSVATFFEPRSDVNLSPAESLITPQNPAKFKHIGTVADYAKGFFSRQLGEGSYLDTMRIVTMNQENN